MFVDILAELKEINEFTNQNKIAVPIGIYGSFDPENKLILEDIKNFLKSQGYKAFISTDLTECCPKLQGMETNNIVKEFLTNDRVLPIANSFYFQ